MNPFKVGDKVIVNPGLYEVKGVVTAIIGATAVWLVLEDYRTIATHISNLKLCVSFIDQSVNGAKVHNSVDGGVNDFVFCGYAFIGQNRQGEVIYVTDDNGNAKYSTEKFDSCNFKFELQPDKKMHSIAFRDGGNGHKWSIINMSDERLSRAKHHLSEYKILDTWYE